ncbi:MAG: TIGR04282 family arsenosugar biosynthesis glycosyltransferase [Leptolyngbyaceae cyanobacterium MO_188.B28]|nr:TIGR04282 family arsenosugar biosynthesis glycosyltransferase [Leptolyngbyaceae cyanobacterium MO_188.B28]
MTDDISYNRLILFTRHPEPGRTKTRLIPHLGAEGAAALQRQMTEYVLTQVLKTSSQFPLSVEVRFEGGNLACMQAWLGRELAYRSQGEGDLGDRLTCAFQQGFEAGMERIVIIGSDCPGITPLLLIQAFNHLQQNDVVLGPAEDGGYYLIGLRQAQPALFKQIAWSTEEVFQQTDAIAQQQGLAVAYLDRLSDVDRPEDLSNWEAVCSTTSQLREP